MPEKTKEEAINVLTKLLIKTDFYEKEKQVDVYVKKTRIYKDLIKMFKELLWERIKNGLKNQGNSNKY